MAFVRLDITLGLSASCPWRVRLDSAAQVPASRSILALSPPPPKLLEVNDFEPPGLQDLEGTVTIDMTFGGVYSEKRW